MKKWSLLLSAVALTTAFVVFKADRFYNSTLEKEKAAVEAAVLDYVEALYNVEPERVEQSVHQELRKRGYYYNKDAYHQADMSFAQLKDLAARWNKDGKRANAQSPKEIVIFDVLDKTASAKLTAEWGVDYFHLVKLDGKWQIMNVLWQSPPPKG